MATETEIKNTEIRLEEKLNLLSTSTEKELIEKAARERLGYVYPNEQIFVDISGN
jgi:cell division protein FtsB